MCFDLSSWLTKIDTLTFANLANVQTVGIGLYLALVIVQAVSATGVSGLRRRLTTLQAAVKSAKMTTEATAIEGLFQEIGRLEIGFHAFNRTLLCVVSGLFVLSLAYFAYCTVWHNHSAGWDGVAFIMGFYLLLPVVLFGGSATHISRRCKDAEAEIKRAEHRYLTAALGKKAGQQTPEGNPTQWRNTA